MHLTELGAYKEMFIKGAYKILSVGSLIKQKSDNNVWTDFLYENSYTSCFVILNKVFV